MAGAYLSYFAFNWQLDKVEDTLVESTTSPSYRLYALLVGAVYGNAMILTSKPTRALECWCPGWCHVRKVRKAGSARGELMVSISKASSGFPRSISFLALAHIHDSLVQV